MFDLTGKTAVIIGGNSTLGSVMGEALGAYGAKVAVVGRNAETSAAAKQRIEAAGGEAAVFQADATSKDDLSRILSEIVEWSGSVDILLNCPGKNSATPFFEITEEEWDSIMDVNLKGVMIACQVFGKRMINQGKGGSIINISSVAGLKGAPNLAGYCATKGGVRLFTKSALPHLHVLRLKGGRQFRDSVSRSRIRATHHSRQCYHSRLLPGRTKQKNIVRRPH